MALVIRSPSSSRLACILCASCSDRGWLIRSIVTSSLVPASPNSVILQDRTTIIDNHYRALRSLAPTIDTRQRKLNPILRSNLDFYSREDSDLGGCGACLC